MQNAPLRALWHITLRSACNLLWNSITSVSTSCGLITHSIIHEMPRLAKVQKQRDVASVRSVWTGRFTKQKMVLITLHFKLGTLWKFSLGSKAVQVRSGETHPHSASSPNQDLSPQCFPIPSNEKLQNNQKYYTAIICLLWDDLLSLLYENL